MKIDENEKGEAWKKKKKMQSSLTMLDTVFWIGSRTF